MEALEPLVEGCHRSPCDGRAPWNLLRAVSYDLQAVRNFQTMLGAVDPPWNGKKAADPLLRDRTQGAHCELRAVKK